MCSIEFYPFVIVEGHDANDRQAHGNVFVTMLTGACVQALLLVTICAGGHGARGPGGARRTWLRRPTAWRRCCCWWRVGPPWRVPGRAFSSRVAPLLRKCDEWRRMGLGLGAGCWERASMPLVTSSVLWSNFLLGILEEVTLGWLRNCSNSTNLNLFINNLLGYISSNTRFLTKLIQYIVSISLSTSINMCCYILRWNL
jgi:hypothetical protein